MKEGLLALVKGGGEKMVPGSIVCRSKGVKKLGE